MDNFAEDWINNIIKQGITYNASDIHFEKFENIYQIRFRIDGILTNKMIFNFNENQIDSIIIKIKILSNMDISEKRKPQDGRIKDFKYNDFFYDIRISTIFTLYGEKIVMRLICKKMEIETFQELGFNNFNDVQLKLMLKKTSGIIYLGGTTGSGKTTTLYSILNYINDDNLNIYTIENPIEKNIKNINQIEINDLAGITYNSTLKALLRQDPDIIIIGEIREPETAQLAIQAALTGHLVIATIHSNFSLDCINRLIDMNVESYLIKASSIGFLSQKLVRKLCPYCKRKINQLSSSQIKWLKNINKNNIFDFNNIDFFEPVGCKHCINGFIGRIALTEVLPFKNINNNDYKNLSINDITDFKNINYDIYEKLKKQITSINELMRIIN